jgi:ribosomal protein L7/L12
MTPTDPLAELNADVAELAQIVRNISAAVRMPNYSTPDTLHIIERCEARAAADAEERATDDRFTVTDAELTIADERSALFAVKAYRERTGLGLIESRNAVIRAIDQNQKPKHSPVKHSDA